MTAYIFNGSDMRLYDNTALKAALSAAASPKLFFVADQWPKSPHARAFLVAAIRCNGIPCRVISKIDDLPTSIRHIYMNAMVHIVGGQLQTHCPYQSWAKRNGVELHVFDDWSALREPPRSAPYKVFTPFWSNVTTAKGMVADSIRARPSSTLLVPMTAVKSATVDASRGHAFTLLRRANKAYDRAHSRTGASTERLGSEISPFIARGVISIREAIAKARDPELVRQLLWREFYYQIAFHDPAAMATYMSHSHGSGHSSVARPLTTTKRDRSQTGSDLRAWKSGHTPFDYINVAMKELRKTGRMPNRLRMLVAEQLTSPHYSGVAWWHGEDHFAAYLEDHDVILNRANWLWVADPHRPWSKPEFRGFSLERQAKNKAVVAFMAAMSE